MQIKEIILSKGFRLNHVAEKLGITPVSFSQLLSRDNTSISTLRKIASIIDCDVTDLLRDEDTHQPQCTCPHCGKPIKIKVNIEQD